MSFKISFLGAAENVTGSRYLVEANSKRILIDCGLYQERDLRSRNWDPFPVAPESIDMVLLTHAHLDHCGYLPKLVKDGFQGDIISTQASADIAKIVLLDSAHIQVEDAKFKAKRHKKEGRKGPHPEVPLYNTEDAEATLPLFQPVELETAVHLGDGFEAVFHEAGHILGSTSIELRIRQNGATRKIIFSGDIGRWGTPILEDPTLFTESDYIIMESTYGNRLHDDRSSITKLLEDIINDTDRRGGNIVIPSFAVERSQEVIYYLNNLLMENKIPHLLIFLDSPMAIKVTKIFREHPELFDDEMQKLIKEDDSPFNLPRLKMTRTVDESKAINHVKGTVIIIAGSGMCTGGRIKHHLLANISRRESTILFVGYQAVGTLGRRIVDGDQEVRVLGQYSQVRAKVVQLHGFSAHADKNELLHWLSGLKNPPKQLFITHGEAEAAHEFAKTVREQKGWNVSVPKFQDEVILD
ncbi:MAG: MBL fold metallo-hydrolase [Calditrichaeota bacterium]|nr:MBL fold metallo-hydrolase [Calditrichota bacterium]